MKKNIIYFVLGLLILNCHNSLKSISIKDLPLQSDARYTIFAYINEGCGYCALLKNHIEKKEVCDNCVNVVYLKEASLTESEIQSDCPKYIQLKGAKEFNKIIPHVKIYDNERGKVVKVFKGFWPDKMEKYLTNHCKN